MRSPLFLTLVLISALPLWSQGNNTEPVPAVIGPDNGADRMLTPPPASGQSYPVMFGSQERSNFLHYGVTFSPAYSDNTLGAGYGHPVSDVSYSVWPTIRLDQTTSRSHLELTYAPGFTFYQRTSARNETDQNAMIGFDYRVSPHVTFSAHDTFLRSSNMLNQPNLAGGSISGAVVVPNESVIVPLADRLNNFGTVGLAFQYSANDMVGAGGNFSNLHYPDPAQVPGLYDSNSQGASAFYAHRFTSQHYVGGIYQYQRLMSYPGGQSSETQTQGAFFFYTFSPAEHFSLSLFGGAQHSNTNQPAIASLEILAFTSRQWNPAGGASLNWQGRMTGAAVSYLHVVSEGGGLIGAVRLDSLNANVRQQITRMISGSISGFYANNNLLGPALLTSNGHTVSETIGLSREFGEHWGVALGYMRIHQTYNIPLIAGTPDTNRELVAISYTFTRPLGR